MLPPSGLTSTSIQLPSSVLIGTCLIVAPFGAFTSHFSSLAFSSTGCAWAVPAKEMAARAVIRRYFIKTPIACLFYVASKQQNYCDEQGEYWSFASISTTLDRAWSQVLQ